MISVFSSMPLKIEYAVENFFFLKLKDLRIEALPFTGRVHFIDKKDRIVAVAFRKELEQP